MPEFSKLKWQCRRGSLELDLLLENFLTTRYWQLSDAEKSLFVALLKREDDEVQAVLSSAALIDVNSLIFQSLFSD